MTHIIIPVVVGLAALLIGLLVGYILRKSIGEKTIGNAETKAKNMLLDAEKNAEEAKESEKEKVSEETVTAQDEKEAESSSEEKELPIREAELSETKAEEIKSEMQDVVVESEEHAHSEQQDSQ